jgi:hypothetical protein
MRAQQCRGNRAVADGSHDAMALGDSSVAAAFRVQAPAGEASVPLEFPHTQQIVLLGNAPRNAQF